MWSGLDHFSRGSSASREGEFRRALVAWGRVGSLGDAFLEG